MISKSSFTEAYERGYRATCRLLLSKGLNPTESEEFAQAAWVRGWEARQQLKDPACVVAWVNSIALRGMWTDKRRSNRLTDLEDNPSVLPQQAAAPVQVQIDATRMLEQCSPLDQSLLNDRYSEGMDMAEIAKRHGMTCVATRVRIYRSRMALRRWATGDACASAA